MKKLWDSIKSAGRWIRRIFEDKDELPSSKRIAGAALIGCGIGYLIDTQDHIGAGVLIGAGLAALGISSWSK